MNAQAKIDMCKPKNCKMLTDNEYMTVAKAAKKLGITRQGLYKRIKAGTAPDHAMVAGRILFYTASVMKECPVGGGKATPPK